MNLSFALSTIGAFGLIAVIFGLLERIAPERHQERPLWRREHRADLCWWFAGYGFRFAADIATIACVAIIVHVLPNHPAGLTNTQPVWLQVIEALVIGDFMQYWVHRVFHGRRLWSIHAIHHSPQELNWISATRVHPIESIVRGPIEMLPLYFLGFSSVTALPLVTITLGLYEIFVHANVGWRFGVFRFVIASPAFHRWHHTAETEGFNKNYAGMFPFFDLAFGTYYLPEYASPSYGLGLGQKMSDSFVRQLANPVVSAVTLDHAA